jgi:hypothetical protein
MLLEVAPDCSKWKKPNLTLFFFFLSLYYSFDRIKRCVKNDPQSQIGLFSTLWITSIKTNNKLKYKCEKLSNKTKLENFTPENPPILCCQLLFILHVFLDKKDNA